MASTYTDIGTELMTTGENAGNWGTKTNTNINILEEAIRGYVSQSIAGGVQTTALTYSDGSTGDAARNMVIALTGSITGNQTVTVTAKEKMWVIDNQTSGAYTVNIKVSGQTGVTWAATDKGTKILYCNGTDVIDTDIGGVGAYDLNGEELILDADADTSLTADTDDQIDIKIGGTDQIKITDGVLAPVTDNDIDLGTSSLEFKDAFFDGTVTSDAFAGPLTGNVTGNASGTAATVTTAAQSNITSLGTLTTLTVDNVIINGATIGHTGDTDLLTVASGALTVAGTIGSGAITSTGIVTGTAFTAGSAVLAEAELELLDGLTAGTAIASKVVTTDASIDTTGQRNLTISGELDAATLDISGAVDIAGTTNLDVVDIDGAVQLDATLTIGANDQGYDVILYGDTASANVTWDTSADDLIFNGGAGLIIPDGQLTLGSTAVSSTAAELNLLDNVSGLVQADLTKLAALDATATEINLIDGGTSTGSITLADADGFIVNDGGTTKLIPATDIKTYIGSSAAADDLTAGDAAVSLATSSGAITIDSNASTVTVDGHTGVTVQSSNSGDITLDSVADIVIDAAGGNVEFKDAGTTQLTLDMDGTAGVQIIKLGVNSDDLVFQQYDGTEVMRVEDGAYLNVSNTTASSSATTGSAIFGGGIGVAADAFIGDDLTLITDSAVLGFGADTDTTLTHTDGTGLTLNGTNKLCFYDTALSIHSSTDGQLDLIADTEIQIAATTVDLNGILDVSGVLVAGGQISAADGTAGAPSISNTGDLNTGLLFSAADTMAFSAGGTSQFTMADGAISPVTDNDIDLGTASLEFKNVYVDGTTFTDALGFGTVVMTLPTADGSANQILTTDGSGALSFVDNSGGTDWQAVKTGAFTASGGQGVFVNTTSSAFTITLPAGSIGDEVSIIDYAGTFDSNNCTIAANGSEKIHGSTDDLTVATERAAFTLVFTDSTQGWLLKDK
jgi:hypothetical protein